MLYVKYKKEGDVGILTIDRPDALNALNSALLDELGRALDAVEPDIRCLIITGAGEKAFVAGADITEMKDFDAAGAQLYADKGNLVFRKLELLPMPVIAAVGGYALGGGCELCLACDIRLCADTAAFGQPEVGLGITPGFGGTQRLPRLIGSGLAKEMIYTAARIDAQRALAIGLVNAVYPAAELMEQALTLARKIARNAPVAVQNSKIAVNDGVECDLDSALALESRLFARCFETQDQKNAMQAFADKGKADPFTGK